MPSDHTMQCCWLTGVLLPGGQDVAVGLVHNVFWTEPKGTGLHYAHVRSAVHCACNVFKGWLLLSAQKGLLPRLVHQIYCVEGVQAAVKLEPLQIACRDLEWGVTTYALQRWFIKHRSQACAEGASKCYATQPRQTLIVVHVDACTQHPIFFDLRSRQPRSHHSQQQVHAHINTVTLQQHQRCRISFHVLAALAAHAQLPPSCRRAVDRLLDIEAIM